MHFALSTLVHSFIFPLIRTCESHLLGKTLGEMPSVQRLSSTGKWRQQALRLHSMVAQVWKGYVADLGTFWKQGLHPDGLLRAALVFSTWGLELALMAGLSYLLWETCHSHIARCAVMFMPGCSCCSLPLLVFFQALMDETDTPDRWERCQLTREPVACLALGKSSLHLDRWNNNLGAFL